MTFQVDNWVLHKVFQNTKEGDVGKLEPNWEGLYKITKLLGNGAFKLQASDEQNITNSWNATHLKQYHFWNLSLSFIFNLIYLF